MIQKEKLILLRKEKRLTQMQVAEEIKVSRQAVSGWETGTVVPSIENLKSLSILYGVPVDYLLNEENERISDGIANSSEQKVHPNKERKILILLFIGIVLVSVGFFLFANGSLFQGEKKQKHHVPIHPLDSSRSYCRSTGELHPLQRCRQNLNCRRC